jgi:hypothetical protein
MIHFVNKNRCSGRRTQKAQKVSNRTTESASAVSNSGAQASVKTPVRLKIAWHVAAVQSVAILDLTGQAHAHGLSALASIRPPGKGGISRPQKGKCL